MGQNSDWFFWAVVFVALVIFIFLPQITARRRRRKREEDLQVGDQVMTIGGFMGELTYLDFDANLARIKLAEGVEVKILPGAISGKRADAAEQQDGEAARVDQDLDEER